MAVLEFLGRLVISLIVVFLLLPVVWLLASPFIIIAAAVLPGTYRSNLRCGFWNVSKAWLEWAVLLPP